MMNKLAQYSYVSIICFIFLLFRSLTKVSEMSAKHLAARCSFDAPLELIYSIQFAIFTTLSISLKYIFYFDNSNVLSALHMKNYSCMTWERPCIRKLGRVKVDLGFTHQVVPS